MRKPASFYFFKRKPIIWKSRYELWMEIEGFNETSEREWLIEYNFQPPAPIYCLSQSGGVH